MTRHRRGAPAADSSSDDNEVDAFTALSQRNKTTTTPQASTAGNIQALASAGSKDASSAAASDDTGQALPVSTTSSMKRHHKISETRQAKMDDLLLELEQDKNKALSLPPSSKSHGQARPKGSFVEHGQEHLTTNIFVGNMAPNITEEDMTEVFRQFGDLYSIKIMWPRSAEERMRGRLTGFVCFMERSDAEDAFQTCNDADPFRVGRLLHLSWGKNVKKLSTVEPIRQRTSVTDKLSLAAPTVDYDAARHEALTIRVMAPADTHRRYFISAVASFVARDGAALEEALLQREFHNPQFRFMRFDPRSSPETQAEHIYYRWRTYSLGQGDGQHNWNVAPFRMIDPHGCYWLPPSLDQQAAAQEVEHQLETEHKIETQKAQRKQMAVQRDYVTGRQLEQKRRGGVDGSATLTAEELREFHVMCRDRLVASRDSICAAMAYCYEKSGAARQVADLLKLLLLDAAPNVEHRIARLFLLSDILFNSQQPGVRNAFLYRDAIERMAPDVFASLGRHDTGGRMTRQKLATAVSAVLGAWANWSVYNPIFLDELQARFEGKEIKSTRLEPTDESVTQGISPAEHLEHLSESKPDDECKADTSSSNMRVAIDRPASRFVVAPKDDADGELLSDSDEVDGSFVDDDADGAPLEETDDDADGEPLDDDADGKPLDDDADGKPLDDDSDGEPLDDDADGEPL